MKKKIKRVCIFTILIILSIFQIVYGFSVTDLTGKSVSNSDATELGNKIITGISTVGSIASVIVLVVIGLKYMLGSVDEKAEYKKSMLPYFIGSMIVFSASTIAGIIYSLAP